MRSNGGKESNRRRPANGLSDAGVNDCYENIGRIVGVGLEVVGVE